LPCQFHGGWFLQVFSPGITPLSEKTGKYTHPDAYFYSDPLAMQLAEAGLTPAFVFTGICIEFRYSATYPVTTRATEMAHMLHCY